MMEELANIPWAIIAPLIGVQIILVIVALIDLSKIHATNRAENFMGIDNIIY
ncbi:Transcriptional regulator OS=Lysinibacillus sphaericus OX=1421 GN=LS41612_22080 PE=4 SV=1 [Lysinibacillus sphaericus]